MGKGRGILWFIYICVLGAGFSKTTALMTRMLGLSVTAYFLMTALLIIAVLLLVYLPCRLVAGRLGAKANGHGRAYGGPKRKLQAIRPADGIFLMLLLGALVLVRLFWAPAAGSAAGWKAYEEALSLHALPDASLSGLYVWVLSLSLRFFAESRAVVICNLVLQAAGGFFLYFGIRMLAGAASASMTLLFMVFLPLFHSSAHMAEPQSLLLFLAGLSLFGCALCARRGRVPSGVLAGLVCAAAGFVHVSLGSIGLLFLGALLGPVRKKGYRAAVLGFVCAFAAAFALLLGLYGLQSGLGPGNAAAGWLNEAVSREYDAVLHSPGLSDCFLTIPAYLLSFLPVFGMLERERDHGEAWILPFVFTVLTELCGMAPLQEQGLRFVFLGVMAGFGVRQMLAADLGQEKETVRKAKTHGRTADAAPAAYADDLEEGGDEMMDAWTEMNKAKDQTQEGGSGPDGGKPGAWLDNPLPVPKRHVKKEMTYAFEPDPDQMYFDIPVSDLDDFDI